MKIVSIFIFSFITLSGILGQIKLSCGVSNPYFEQIVASESKNHHSSSNFPFESDCHDGEIICLACYLAHCDLSSNSIISFGLFSLIHNHGSLEVLASFYNFSSTPFRPPIV